MQLVAHAVTLANDAQRPAALHFADCVAAADGTTGLAAHAAVYRNFGGEVVF